MLTNQKRVADEILRLRLAGDLKAATKLCVEATRTYPNEYLFSKIQADLCFQQKDYESTFIALGDYLSKIPPSNKPIADFAQRYYRLKRVVPSESMSKLADILHTTIDQTSIDPMIVRKVKEIIRLDLTFVKTSVDLSKQLTEFASLLKDDSRFPEIARLEKTLEAKSKLQLEQVLDGHVLNRPRNINAYRVDLYCASLYERFEQHAKAIKVLTEILTIRIDPVAARTLFRICRTIKNYDSVDDLLIKNPSLLRAHDFNILYELVYYFEAKNDFPQLQGVLRTIDKSFAQNLPVLRTLRNFYIRFGMLDEVKRLEPIIRALFQAQDKATGKYVDELAESETELVSTAIELHSQLEHQKQLAAISDLTTGISHELGQPITNIRYTIQFYKKLLDKNITKVGVFNVFDSILEETERMGALIQRLSPLTSSRSVFEKFDMIDRINKRVQLENPRLRDNRITVFVEPKESVTIFGDPVKFDQLISNLLLNAIDAIKERKKPAKNKIDIKVEDGAEEVCIFFSDNGIGIPIKNRNIIFDPFFSTKAPGKGEGLGLFIVWNLLKFQGGKISVDAKYTNGARFIITIPKNHNFEKEPKND